MGAGINYSSQELTFEDTYDPFIYLIEEIELLRERDTNVVQERTSADDLINVDNDAITTASVQTDAEIIVQIKRSRYSTSDSERRYNAWVSEIPKVDCIWLFLVYRIYLN